MTVRLGSPERNFVRSFKAVRADGSTVEILEFLILGVDPTATGTIWQTRSSFKTHRLSTGEDVELGDEGTAFLAETGETLMIAEA